MSAASIIVAIIVIFYLLVILPDHNETAECNRRAAEIAKEFGDVNVECIEFDTKKESDIYRVFVLFEGKHHSDPKNRYKILETSYKSDSQKEKNKKYRRVTKILKALPYGYIAISGSAYKWDNFLKMRESGQLLETEKEAERRWEENRLRYE